VDLFARNTVVASAGDIVYRSLGDISLTTKAGFSLESSRIGLHHSTRAAALTLEDSALALSAATGLKTVAWSMGIHTKSNFSSNPVGGAQMFAAASAHVNSRAHADFYSSQDVRVESKYAGMTVDASTVNLRSGASVDASANVDFDLQGGSVSVAATGLDHLLAGTVDVSATEDVTIYSHAHLVARMPVASFAGQNGISLLADAVHALGPSAALLGSAFVLASSDRISVGSGGSMVVSAGAAGFVRGQAGVSTSALGSLDALSGSVMALETGGNFILGTSTNAAMSTRGKAQLASVSALSATALSGRVQLSADAMSVQGLASAGLIAGNNLRLRVGSSQLRADTLGHYVNSSSLAVTASLYLRSRGVALGPSGCTATTES
jgi:hypothetical protein